MCHTSCLSNYLLFVFLLKLSILPILFYQWKPILNVFLSYLFTILSVICYSTIGPKLFLVFEIYSIYFDLKKDLYHIIIYLKKDLVFIFPDFCSGSIFFPISNFYCKFDYWLRNIVVISCLLLFSSKYRYFILWKAGS